MAVTGLLGGFVSSTIVFANLPILLKEHPKFKLAIIAAALCANLAMLIEVSMIIFVASPDLLLFIIKPIIVMATMSVVFVVYLLYFQKLKKHRESLIANPFSWVALFRTALFIGLIFPIVVVTKHVIGTHGIFILSFLSGLFDIHGITLATALLYLDHQLTIDHTSAILYTAILATYITKFILLWVGTPRQFALQTSFFLLGVLLTGVATFWIVYH